MYATPKIGLLALLVLCFLATGLILLIVHAFKGSKTARGILIALPIIGLAAAFFMPVMAHKPAGADGEYISMSFVGLLVLLSLVTGLILLIVHAAKGSKGARGALIGLGVVALLAGTFLFTFRDTSSPEPLESAVVATPAEQTDSPGSAEVTPEIWRSGLEEQFNADIYSSLTAAVRNLGGRLDKAARKIIDGAELPQKIYLLKGENQQDLVTELGRSLEKVLPGIKWFVVDESQDLKSGEMAVRLRVTQHNSGAPWAASGEQVLMPNGSVDADVIVPGSQSTINARYIEKPWVANFSEFVNRYPQRQWMLARSERSCATENEARKQALTDAAYLIGPLVHKKRGGVNTTTTFNSSEVNDNGFIVDRFVQSFAGASGPIWREALLLDVSDEEKIAAIAYEKNMQARFHTRNLLQLGISLGGMLILITIVYIFLNAATKGYYTWSLRIAAVVLFAVGLFVAMKLFHVGFNLNPGPLF